MSYQWIAADLLTGRVIADLPGFEPQWPLTRTISTDDSGSGTLYLTKSTPDNWQDAIRPGSSLLACFDDQDPSMAIAWCGYVSEQPTVDVDKDQVAVSMSTFEAVLDRCFVGDTTYTTSRARNDIIADLVNTWFIPGTGIPLALNYTPGVGMKPAENIVMQNTDNASVKGRIDQIIGQLGGEYTVKWAWTNNGQAITPTLYFGTRIGVQAAAGMDPLVTFQGPTAAGGSIISMQVARSYAADSGANKVVAYSTGQGSTTPYGAPAYAPADGRPTFEYRWQPKASVSTKALGQYAAQAVKILGPGKTTYTCVLTNQRAAGRRFAADWDIGDDIGLSYPSAYTDENGNTVPVRALPDGLNIVARALSVQFDDTSWTPTFADKQVYVAADS